LRIGVAFDPNGSRWDDKGNYPKLRGMCWANLTQRQLLASTVRAATFFVNLRCQRNMKMEWQEKNEQQ